MRCTDEGAAAYSRFVCCCQRSLCFPSVIATLWSANSSLDTAVPADFMVHFLLWYAHTYQQHGSILDCCCSLLLSMARQNHTFQVCVSPVLFNNNTRLTALSGTTQLSRYWYQKGKKNLNFTKTRDSEWQWHRLGHMQVCTSLQTEKPCQHQAFLKAGCPSCRPTNSVKALN